MYQLPNPIDEAALIVGGRGELSRLLHVTRAAIGNWKTRGVPIEYCADIEFMTSGRVGRKSLRPNDWQRIWPELAAAPDVNDASTEQSEVQGVA